MQNIFVIGAGRASTALIEYLLNHADKENWKINVGDSSYDLAHQRVKNHPYGKAIKFDVNDKNQREYEIGNADLVVSFLPPFMHTIVAKECLKSRCHLVTASYLTVEMQELDPKVKKADLIFLNEMGLDPGIDHMNSIQLITKIKNEGGKIISFKSYGSGLISPDSRQNPWKYKFTWSPMNVVLAGQNGAKYLEDNQLKIVPYNRIFNDPKKITIPGYGDFEAYPNRDSLIYREKYDLNDVPNFFRATLRKPGYSEAWDQLIKLGLTDNSYTINNSEDLTYRNWVISYLPEVNGKKPEKALADFLEIPADGKLMQKLLWLGILSNDKIPLKDATPAMILLHLLEDRWKMNIHDTDLVILRTEIKYELNRKLKKIVSTMTCEGKDNHHTAMSKTVGLPAAIGAKLILNKKINEHGVIIPIHKDIYEPVLKELKKFKIDFVEKEIEVKGSGAA
jgi:saccharopine dehydrogenase-like NADP-dependent oxidoreductase